jgi:hypothetical protein
MYCAQHSNNLEEIKTNVLLTGIISHCLFCIEKPNKKAKQKQKVNFHVIHAYLPKTTTRLWRTVASINRWFRNNYIVFKSVLFVEKMKII